MPSWIAHLPNQVGYPAGGLLAADEWKGMIMVYCPVIVSDEMSLDSILLIPGIDSLHLG